jgi:hypothetical protein
MAMPVSRVMHDLCYIEHWCPWLDLKILLETVGNVVSRDVLVLAHLPIGSPNRKGFYYVLDLLSW